MADRTLELSSGLAGAIAHVLEHPAASARNGGRPPNRPAELLHHRHTCKRRNEAIAGGAVVGQDDVAGRLAADIEPPCACICSST